MIDSRVGFGRRGWIGPSHKEELGRRQNRGQNFEDRFLKRVTLSPHGVVKKHFAIEVFGGNFSSPGPIHKTPNDLLRVVGLINIWLAFREELSVGSGGPLRVNRGLHGDIINLDIRR